MHEYHIQKDPFMKQKDNTTKMMKRLFIALVPIILFSFYKNGLVPYINNSTTSVFSIFYPLIFILIGALSTFIIEGLYSYLILKKRGPELKHYILSFYSVFPGLFLSLILPINTPIEILLFGSFAATLIGKMLFGGFGYNVFNPALIGRLFIISAYASVIVSNGGYLNPYEVDTIAGSTPLSTVVDGIGNYNTLVAPFGSLWNFLLGIIPGTIGETSALLCILAFVYLGLTKTIKWKIPVLYVGTVFIMTYIIGLFNGVGIWYPLFQILSGGLMFGAVFMATDPVTSPTTNFGQVLYGVCLGILTVVFRFLTPYPEGVLTSILTMNMLVFLIDKVGLKKNIKKFSIILTVLFICLLGISYGVSTKFKVSETDPNFNIISKEINNNIYTYVVTEKGYSSNIKAKIVINNTITSIEILDQNDSFFSKVEDVNYIDTLIKGQANLSEVDTVSGVTISSTALKKLVINTLADYKKGGGEITNPEPVIPKDAEILDKTLIGTQTIYTVSSKSFAGFMNLEITVQDKKVVSVEIIQSNDTYLATLEENYYIDTLISNQDILDEVDAISGVTRSSEAIKRAIKLVKDDINE